MAATHAKVFFTHFLEIQETRILVVSDFIMKLGTIDPVQDNAAGLWIEQSKKAGLSALTGASAPRPSVGPVPIWIGEWQEIKVNLILERRRVTFNMLDPSNFHWFTKTSTELQSRIWMVTWPPYALVAGSTYVKTRQRKQ